MISDAESAEIDHLLAHYRLRRNGAPTAISTGTLNRNYRVPVANGTPEGSTVFARCHRADLDLDRVRREHAITRWVADRGIPAVAALPTSDGDTVVEESGHRWAIFPWIAGRTPARGAVTATEAESIGVLHGRIQRALAEHPESDEPNLETLGAHLAWDTAASLETLARIEQAASDASADHEVIEALAYRRDLLEGDQPRPFSDSGWLPCQLLHGDFHDQQILLDPAGAVLGVVDWELVRVTSRVWELIRSLSYGQLLETEGLDAYMRGFRRHVSLTERECRDGIELWWQSRLHSAWVYEAYFLEGNERVEPLFAETDAHLRRFADEAWRTTIADRLVTAAVQRW